MKKKTSSHISTMGGGGEVKRGKGFLAHFYIPSAKGRGGRRRLSVLVVYCEGDKRREKRFTQELDRSENE